MKQMLFAMAFAPVLLCGACAQEEGQDQLDVAIEVQSTAKLAAVLIYADWCGSCKVLDPKVQSVKGAGNLENTTFITLDYTERDDEAFFASADEAGVGEVVRSHLSEKIKTGQLLLIDLDDSIVVGTIKKDLDEAEIESTINAAAEAA